MVAANSKIRSPLSNTVARHVHPEDLDVGDHVVLAEVSYEFPSFNWCGADTTVFPPDKPIRLTFLPLLDAHEPMKVKRICLPFILCKPFNGDHRVVDLRQVTLARVDREFANAVKKANKVDAKKNSSGKTQADKKKRKSRKHK